MPEILIVPGWGGSGADHWQSQWGFDHRVELDDWFDPRRESWIGALDAALAQFDEPPIVVAHSLGCIISAHARFEIRAALLVAPADVDRSLRDFGPVPTEPLPFPSLVVTSDNDPYVSLSRARDFADLWHSELVVIPGAGHLNAESNLGAWPAGRALLERLRGGHVACRCALHADSPGLRQSPRARLRSHA